MHIIATAGHVDHGKSTLVRALTGVNPDRLKEEQQRGLTIELGFAFMTLDSGRQVSFIDVPGHIRFISNMLAGVGAVDAVMFVVSAIEGWKPQSAEHLAILQLLGISAGIVVLTHADALDAETLELAQLDVIEHTTGTFLEHAPIVFTSCTQTGGESNSTGGSTNSSSAANNAASGSTNSSTANSTSGIPELRAALDQLTAALPAATDQHRPRLWIDRSFVVAGAGRVVTGTLTKGSLAVGETLTLAPQMSAGNTQISVRAIQSQGENHDRIGPGHRVALNVTGADAEQLQRGVAVVRENQWHLTSKFDAQLTALDSLSHEITRRGAYALYVGSGEWLVRLRVLGSDRIAPGETGNVRLFLDHRLPLVTGDRFILRELGRSETVGGGVVLDVDPVLNAVTAKPDMNVERVIAERGWTDVDELERLTGQRVPAVLGKWVAPRTAVDELAAEVAELVSAAGELGLDVARLDERQRLVLELLDDVTVADGKAFKADQTDTLAQHYLIAQLAEAPFAPSQDFDAAPAELAELARRGFIVKADGIWFAASAVDQAAEVVAGLLAAKPEGITMAEIRDALGTTRKFALPLANCLDRIGATRRRGDLRIAGARLPSSD